MFYPKRKLRPRAVDSVYHRCPKEPQILGERKKGLGILGNRPLEIGVEWFRI